MADREVGRRTVEGWWTCPSCGNRVDGRHSSCPNCGTPRGAAETVALPDNPDAAASMTHDEFRHLRDKADHVAATPAVPDVTPITTDARPHDTSDWICQYCGSSVPAWRRVCQGCGHPRDEGDVTYHEAHGAQPAGTAPTPPSAGAQQQPTSAPDRRERAHGSWTCAYCGSLVPETLDACPSCGSDRASQRATDQRESPGPPAGGLRSALASLLGRLRSNPRRLGMALAAVVLAVVGIAAAVSCVRPHPTDIVPASFSWEREIYVDQVQAVDEAGWNVPGVGGDYVGEPEIYDQRLEYHHDERVHDGWHDETYTDYERRVVGTETYETYEDNGDGSYDVVTHERDVYGDVPVERVRTVEDYHYEPRYQTKYYYRAAKWVTDARCVRTSGDDHEAAWGEVSLASGDPLTLVGREREGRRSERYWVTDEGGSTYECGFELWSSLGEGRRATVMHRRGSDTIEAMP